MEPITDLTTLGELTGTMERPKALDANDRSGTEGITQDEIQLPRLAIAQGLSPQLVPGEGKYIKGLTIGEMFNDVSEDIYGTGPLVVVPVMRHVTRIEFDPNDRKVPLDRNVPAGDPRLKWQGNEPPRATEFMEFVSLLIRPGKAPEPVVVSIKTTNKQQRAAAKLWTTYIATRNAAIYTGLYHVSSKIEKGKNKKGEDTLYGVFIVKNAGFIPLENKDGTPHASGVALSKFAKDFHDSLAGKTIKVDREVGADDNDTSFDTATMDETQTSRM